MKYFEGLFIAILFCFGGEGFSKTQKGENSKERKPTKFKMSLALIANSKTIRKGAEIWPHSTVFPGVSITFFDKVTIAGPRIIYHPFDRKHFLDLKMGFYWSDDGKPFLKFDSHNEDHRNSRKGTIESYLGFKYKFGYRKKFYLGFNLYRDLKVSDGLYTELLAGIPIAPYTSLGQKLGFGEKSYNEYYYGAGAESGGAYYGVFIKGVVPHLPWKGIIFITGEYTTIISGTNRHADRIRGRYSHFKLSGLLSWNFFSI